MVKRSKINVGDIAMNDEKKFALRMVVDGKEREVSYEELALSNNLAQEALVRLLVEKKVIKPQELVDMMTKVKKERYRTPDDLPHE
jgi:hypothetical protein